MKTTTIIPAPDVLATHELAALEVRELRRKGVPCHLEDCSDSSGHRVDIVQDVSLSTEEVKPEGEGDDGSQHSSR